MINFFRSRILVIGAVFLVAVAALVLFSFRKSFTQMAPVPPPITQEDTISKRTFAPESESQPDQPARREPVSTPGTTVNPITKAAVEAGLLGPASRLNQIANFLTAGTQSGVMLFLRPGQTDREMLSVSLEAVRPDQSSLYASASFAEGPAGYEAVYDTVEYGTIPCPEVQKMLFSNLKESGALKKSIKMLDGGAVKVFLMPAGSGCVVIKKEVVK